jgi:hypothetical protein
MNHYVEQDMLESVDFTFGAQQTVGYMCIEDRIYNLSDTTVYRATCRDCNVWGYIQGDGLP